MHSTDKVKDRYFGSGRKLAKAIKRYGRKNFKKEILEFLPNRSSLIKREEKIINEDLLKDSLCMNVVVGGDFIPYESCRRGGLKGSMGYKKRLQTDIKFSKRMKKLASKTIKATWNAGKFKPMFGKDNSFYNKHHTEKTKQSMRAKAHLRIGNKNSQFGTCWITNGKENRKVKKENLVLENDWCLGRVCKVI